MSEPVWCVSCDKPAKLAFFACAQCTEDAAAYRKIVDEIDKALPYVYKSLRRAVGPTADELKRIGRLTYAIIHGGPVSEEKRCGGCGGITGQDHDCPAQKSPGKRCLGCGGVTGGEDYCGKQCEENAKLGLSARCIHGDLKRKCYTCDLEDEVLRLREEVAGFKKDAEERGRNGASLAAHLRWVLDRISDPRYAPTPPPPLRELI